MGDVETKNLLLFSKVLEAADEPKIKLQALDVFLGFTGSREGLECLYKIADNTFAALIYSTFNSNADIAEKAATALINIAAEPPGVGLLLSMKFSKLDNLITNNFCKRNVRDGVVSACLEHITNGNSPVTRQAGMILANLSRYEEFVQRVCDAFEDVIKAIERLSEYALKIDLKYDYLSSLLANLSQLPEITKIFTNSNRFLLQRLFSLIDCQNNTLRRNAVISLVRNVSLSVENHGPLLNPDIDLLPRLLLPLAGPEEFDDEDNDKLPLDLQYLPSDKTRESDPRLRKMLLEILMQFGATKLGRETMRKLNVYVILRELHKWERDVQCMDTLEDLVNILIRTEEEIGADNLNEIDVPSDLIEKFSKMN